MSENMTRFGDLEIGVEFQIWDIFANGFRGKLQPAVYKKLADATEPQSFYRQRGQAVLLRGACPGFRPGQIRCIPHVEYVVPTES